MRLTAELPSRLAETWKRAISQFLALPLVVIAVFVAAAVAIYQADTAWSKGHVPAGFALLGELLGDSKSLATLLSTVASSIITVTSITFSLLLVALQQGSSALTTQVTDQFLMRRTNQFYFGYFVGLSIFVLISLVTASEIHRPVFGTTTALVLTAGALCMIVVMIYSTIDQMRPQQIVRAIQRHVLLAREKQLPLLRQCRREPQPDWPILTTLRSTQSGHVVHIDVAKLRAAISGLGTAEVQFPVPLGRYLAFGETIADIRTPRPTAIPAEAVAAMRSAILAALSFEDGRDLKRDAALGIGQLSDIAWTSVSTAKSNPNPGRAVIESMRDILSRWAEDGEIAGDASSPIVIADAAPEEAMDALENIIVAASESMQAQTLADAFRTISMLLHRVPDAWAARLADISRRALASLGEHVLTRELELALNQLEAALAGAHFAKEAEQVRDALRPLAATLGRLNSRSTRVPAR